VGNRDMNSEPSVTLAPMTQATYEAWVARTVPEYAAEHVNAGNWPAEGALERAAAEFSHYLPDGRATPGHHLWSILDAAGSSVGILWTGPRGSGAPGALFIYDIAIDPEQRGRGYGRAALEALHAWARAHGFGRVGLHVFGSNDTARRLYLRAGYVETDVMMEKRL
jgi:GNAT superfamily N-acetyltransferase